MALEEAECLFEQHDQLPHLHARVLRKAQVRTELAAPIPGRAGDHRIDARRREPPENIAAVCQMNRGMHHATSFSLVFLGPS